VSREHSTLGKLKREGSMILRISVKRERVMESLILQEVTLVLKTPLLLVAAALSSVALFCTWVQG
jgi:hypothetical protein